MRHAAAVVAAAAASVSVGLTARADEPAAPVAPATEQVLLPAPDAAAPTTRGVFVRDPGGQIDDLAAVGHLVAWTTGATVVVADERGGPVLTLPYAGQRVAGIRMLRGPGTPAAPQLAITSCSSARASSCGTELLTLTPSAPLSVLDRSTGNVADAAARGWAGDGKRLIIRRKHTPASAPASCKAPLRIADIATGEIRRLPDAPLRDKAHPKCRGVLTGWIAGRFALIEVRRLDPEYSIEADYVYGIDLTAKGKKLRWRFVEQTGSYTDGSGANWSVGPAVRGETLFWEQVDSEALSAFRLSRFELPGASLRGAAGRGFRGTSDAVAPDGHNVCAIAATDAAIYELANPSCSQITTDDAAPSEIRRVVNPAFT